MERILTILKAVILHFVSCLVSGPVCTQGDEEILWNLSQKWRMLYNGELCDLYMFFSVVLVRSRC